MEQHALLKVAFDKQCIGICQQDKSMEHHVLLKVAFGKQCIGTSPQDLSMQHCVYQGLLLINSILESDNKISQWSIMLY